jgi:hypothetical protein
LLADDTFFGQWKITKHIGTNASRLKADEAEKWVNEVAILSSESASLKNQLCKNPTYKLINIETLDFFFYEELHYLDKNGIGITTRNKINLLVIRCNNNDWDSFLSRIVVIDKNHLLITYWDSFFILEREKTNKSLKPTG